MSSLIYDRKPRPVQLAKVHRVKAGLRQVWHRLEPDAKARSAVTFFSAYVAIVAGFGALMSYVTKMIALG